ncbi:MAG: proline--tRNA ligase [Rhodospirillales bacterium]|nr:proline--tRNA ligase [Rhodospirillales bacterium]MCY4003498.1 proline--tRNA ligase [Rhodospirillales bacterium]MXX22028.1 proline--tRNA ligase [Rhodospirillales bacterium]MYE19335.1 proline--tRNA ligase [Rhodospirillales bacterium]
MLRTRFPVPTQKDDPAEAQIVSHRLMLRAGLVRQASAGIYSWLPMGFRVLKKIEDIVRAEQNAAGAVEVLMPTIQAADLWKASGRYEDYGLEMLRITDRHEREMLYGPTNEEQICEIAAEFLKSYRDLPKNLYHIQWKFRDELRPRFGVMRGREFLMKDNYSFDVDAAASRLSYHRMFLAYLRTFQALGLTSIPVRAESGPIGGDMSHEFVILADTGESGVFCDRGILDHPVPGPVYDDPKELQRIVDQWTGPYAATDDMHEPERFEQEVPEERRVEARGIEVGHVFYFGTKYSEKLGVLVDLPDGSRVPVEMGSYGIGVSRLVGAIIEAFHDDRGILWPASVAPFQVGLANLRQNDRACAECASAMYDSLTGAGVEVLYDDRDERAGTKLADLDLIGFPWQVVVGPRGVAQGVVELRARATGESAEVSPEDALQRIQGA